MMRKLAWSIFALLLGVLICIAQEKSPASTEAAGEPLETFKVSTHLVVLDVSATDKKGRAVTDLKAGDFTVFEDGKAQKISVFELQQPPSSSAPAKVELPPNVYGNFPTFLRSRTRNVIVLDTLISAWTSQSYAKQQLIKFVNEAPVNEPIAIFQLWSHGELRMLQDFTTDRDLLRKAANNVGTELAVPVEQHDGKADQKQARGERSMDAYYRYRALRSTQQAFQNLAATLANYPGRKNLIWISDRSVVSRSRQGSLTEKAFELPRQDSGKGKTVKALVDSHVAVYPVDPAGLSAHPCGATTPAMYGTADSISSTSVSGTGCPRSYAIPWMQELAKTTGGKAYYNGNDVARFIEDGIKDGSTYYVIGYYPSNPNWDGTLRKVHVKVNRDNVDVRHRAGYMARLPKAFATQSPKARKELEQVLSLDTPVLNELTFKARLAMPSAQTGKQILVQYAIAAGGLDFQRDQNGREQVSVECVAQAYSEKHEIVQTKESTHSETLNPEAFKRIAQKGFTCDQNLDLPPGNYLVKLAVRDNHTGALGTIETINLSLSNPAAAGQ